STGIASASSVVNSDYPASNALDGDDDTYWYSNNQTDPAPWWQIDFASPLDLAELTISWYPGLQPRDFNIQRWDGSSWITVRTIVDNTLDEPVIAFDPPITASRVRFNITRPMFQGYPTIIREVR